MNDRALDEIYQAIIDDPMNAEMGAKGYIPVYTASTKSRIVIVGQAPGRKAQESMKPWNGLLSCLPCRRSI